MYKTHITLQNIHVHRTVGTLETIEHEIEKSNKVSVKVVECRKKIKDAVQKHKEKINSLTTTVSSPQYNMTSKTIKAALSSTQASTSTKPDRIMDRMLHEAIGQRTPSELYQPSARPYPRRVPQVEYPLHYEVRKVSTNGGIRWASRWVAVSIVLGEQFIGLEEIDDGIWHVFFGPHLLGYMIDELGKIEDRAGFLSRTHQRQQQLSTMSPD